jgi:hypothetical protein
MSGWGDCKAELEREFPFLGTIGAFIQQSQVILTTIDELRDDNIHMTSTFDQAMRWRPESSSSY